MSVELDEVYRFIAAHEPFTHLPDDTLRALPAKMGITYVRRGDAVVSPGERNDSLYIIRSGAVDIVGDNNTLLDRRGEGLNFGYSTLVGEPESRYLMQAVEDSVLMILPRQAFDELLAAHPDMHRFFQTASRRVRAAAQEVEDLGSADVLRTPVSDVAAARALVTCGPDTAIAAAAQLMEDSCVSCLVVDGGEELGILTDRDLRARVVARRVDPDRPVSEVMTTPVLTIDGGALVFEAVLAMSEAGIHHLPVRSDDAITGVISSSDFMRLLQTDPIYLAADVGRASYDELAGAYQRAVAVAVRFFERGASAAEAQRLLTAIADAVARRLVEVGVDKLGAPPVPFAFVAVGSQARSEMGPASDQDNALVLADSFDPDTHGEYFAHLGQFICQGLAHAGQALCPGEMMASNPAWRMTASQWAAAFHGWVTAPDPNALLHAQVFFDFRAVAGAGEGWREMADGIRKAALSSARGSKRLHTHLAALATFREPPIGIFRGFVVERSGEYAATLDIKRGGTAAVVQMARLYALTAGVDEVETDARLRAAAGSTVSEKGAADLLDAYTYLSDAAMRHQAAQVRAGEAPNYHIDPKQLPERDKAALRDAFGVIKSMQNGLANKYPTRAV
ncbi:DUF294 nucleotidyltransferase-like domain-containing protein [Corynebacterium sp. Q4381]|uniref:DUF294 nucleotidyltransferase-like domain-containing protein n=1 Tax=Corynebacterium sp. Marseille-Q4381 TaxID=3121597 RepID=UPI002FE69FED